MAATKNHAHVAGPQFSAFAMQLTRRIIAPLARLAEISSPIALCRVCCAKTGQRLLKNSAEAAYHLPRNDLLFATQLDADYEILFCFVVLAAQVAHSSNRRKKKSEIRF